MNRDIAEVNSSNSPMLPGSFLYEKEPQYDVRVWDQESTSPNGVSADMEVKSKFKWLLCASTYLTYSKKKNQSYTSTGIAYCVCIFQFLFLMYNKDKDTG